MDAYQQQQETLGARCRDNLQRVVSPEYAAWETSRLLNECSDTHVQHWAGGTYAHGLAQQSLAPPHTTQPSPLLQGAIDRAFGSLEGMCRTLQNAAPGSAGFLWLSSNREGELQVNRTFRYATPLPLTPLLALPSGLFPSPGICQRLNFSTASRRYAEVLAHRCPHLYE